MYRGTIKKVSRIVFHSVGLETKITIGLRYGIKLYKTITLSDLTSLSKLRVRSFRNLEIKGTLKTNI